MGDYSSGSTHLGFRFDLDIHLDRLAEYWVEYKFDKSDNHKRSSDLLVIEKKQVFFLQPFFKSTAG